MTKKAWFLLFLLFTLTIYYTSFQSDISDIFDPWEVKISKNYSRCVGKITMTTTVKMFFWEDESEKRIFTGSGFLVDKKQRKILTNWHVITVTASERKKFALSGLLSYLENTEYIFTDFRGIAHKATALKPSTKYYDLAEMTIDINEKELEDLFEADIDDSGTAEECEEVIVYGFPGGYNKSISKGIISSLNTNVRDSDEENKDLVQTDASVNFGNSGGPMVRVKNGKVIAVIASVLRDTERISYAVPIYYWSKIGWSKQN